jgi:hypothetical protein
MLYRVRVVCGVVPKSTEKKSDEEGKKRQRKGKREKIYFYNQVQVLIFHDFHGGVLIVGEILVGAR